MLNPDVVAWYDKKTDWLLAKYGPGPRIHFHTGLADDSPPAAGTAAIQKQMFTAQERLLQVAATRWDARKTLSGRIVDVGCGLGGSALWFAGNVAGHVTAVTPVARHAAIVRDLAAAAGLAPRVHVEVGEAHTLPGEGRFDAAYAIDASNYFDRCVWFQRMAAVLRRPGYVFIEDTFVVDPAYEAPFNRYWLSRIGTAASYLEAATDAGFECIDRHDVSDGAAGFYRWSVAHSQALLEEKPLSSAETEQRRCSIAWQTRLADGYKARAVEDLLLAFRIG